MATLMLKPEHGYVLLAAGAIAVESMWIGHSVMDVRARLFGKEFKERPAVKAMFEEHKKAYGSQPFCVLGYPDMGNGKFSQQLTYAEWLEFNNVQRGHQNMMESLPSTLALLLTAGAFYPIAAASLGAGYIVGRAVYAKGYAKNGAKGREAGAGIAGLSVIGLLGTTLYAGYALAF